MRSITFTAQRSAEVTNLVDDAPPGPAEIMGRTLVSLTSPGTEINWAYLGDEFPRYPGYAAVVEVVEVGPDVAAVAVGDVVLTSGYHREFVRCAAVEVTPVPDGLAPDVAVFARLIGVGMTALNAMQARAPSRVLVTGLGPIGNLAAQVFAACGFTVTAVDPSEARRELAVSLGLADVRGRVTAPGPDIKDAVRTHVECSGHEQATLDGINVVGRLGEVFLVGVPWRKATDLSAHDVLNAIFMRYVSVHSGWEWQIPRHPQPDRNNSIADNYRAAMDWLLAGRVRTDGIAGLYTPEQAPDVYRGLLAQSLPTIAAAFDWRA